jgi:hypothetical protein
MNAKQAIKYAIDAGDMVGLPYLDDLSDAELMRRPCPGCNHINWQVGHLIAAEHEMISQAFAGAMPLLPAGFAERYSKEAATSDEPNSFLKKDELLGLHKKVRAATLAALEKLDDTQLDAKSPVEFCSTMAELFSMQGSHWLMHAGQWAVVRRQLGRKPLF